MTDEFHEVGCRKCGHGGKWGIYTDGKGNFKAVHSCGHKSDFEIVRKPDGYGISWRLLT